jgi:hypothetical protein
MNAFWSYFWPPFGAAMAVGILSGALAFRRRAHRKATLAVGAALAILAAALWHGPLGAADRFSSEVERTIREALVNNEIPEVSGHLHHDPLTRRVLLSGPADDFQRSELIKLMNIVPGVGSATWTDTGGGLPLIAEGIADAVLGFLLGLLVAYLVELRRRYNAQWNW